MDGQFDEAVQYVVSFRAPSRFVLGVFVLMVPVSSLCRFLLQVIKQAPKETSPYVPRLNATRFWRPLTLYLLLLLTGQTRVA